MDRGKLSSKGPKTHKGKVALARQYIDAGGRQRWQGTSSLKKSQFLSES
jgi:hypothetical protein